MDPLSIGLIGGASLLGGIGNYLANKSAADRAEMLYNKSFQEWLKLNIPDPEQQKLVLEEFVVEGTLNPELERSIEADPSAFKDIVASADLQASENRALSELQGIGNSGGLRLQDKAALQEAQLENSSRAQGNRKAISADFARRGQGGSGFELASQLSEQQAGADREARSGLDIASKAQDRALQAIMGAGDLASKYRGQEFNEKSAKATAADRINLFNTENARDVHGNNIRARNAAQERNLNQRQMTSDKNVAQRNYQQESNKNLLQQKFDNEARKLSGMTSQNSAMAQNAIQQGKNEGNFYSNLANGVSDTGRTYLKYKSKNK